ncbi:6,7-dimethyl-8-ribityllumazine synthase [Escherichia coli]|nr:6,7-dimethyl-8-ribityllumazine synthase [Escherichia coli]
MNIIEANVATPDARVAITIARFNNFINDSLLEGAIDALKRIGQVKDENITVVWVPGAYELPLAAGALAKTGKYDAVIALGTVIRGALPILNMSLVVQATAWRMLPRTAKFRLLLGF